MSTCIHCIAYLYIYTREGFLVDLYTDNNVHAAYRKKKRIYVGQNWDESFDRKYHTATELGYYSKDETAIAMQEDFN